MGDAGTGLCLMGGVYVEYRWAIRGLYPPETCPDPEENGCFVRFQTEAEGVFVPW